VSSFIRRRLTHYPSARILTRRALSLTSRLRPAQLLVAALLLASSCTNPAAGNSAILAPDARITLNDGSMFHQFGFSPADGILVFHDGQYRVHPSAIAPPSGSYTASGRIYNLERAAGIEGNYLSQYHGRLLTSPAGIQIVVFPPLTLPPGVDHAAAARLIRSSPAAATGAPGIKGKSSATGY